MSNELNIKSGLIVAGDLIQESIIYASGVLPIHPSGIIGTSGVPWNDLYVTNTHTGDIHMKNEKGDWTIKEEADYLMVINNTSGKIYKMVLDEL